MHTGEECWSESNAPPPPQPISQSPEQFIPQTIQPSVRETLRQPFAPYDDSPQQTSSPVGGTDRQAAVRGLVSKTAVKNSQTSQTSSASDHVGNNSLRRRRNRGPNVIILSGAGKPIFVRHSSGSCCSGNRHIEDTNVSRSKNTFTVPKVDRRRDNELSYSYQSQKYDGECDDLDEENEWVNACGLLQALRANVLSFGLGSSAPLLGDMHSLRAGKKMIVFLNTQALTLVAISDNVGQGRRKKMQGFYSNEQRKELQSSKSNYTKVHNKCRKGGGPKLSQLEQAILNDTDGEVAETEAWLRLQLEYVYSQVLFTLTDQVQSIFRRSPNYDLRTMMGSNVNASLRNLLDRFDPVDWDSFKRGRGGFGCRAGMFLNGSVGIDSSTRSTDSKHDNEAESSFIHGSGCGSFLTAGVECVFPIQPDVRDSASRLVIDAFCRGRNRNGSNRSDPSHEPDDAPLFAILMVGTRLVTLVQPSDCTSQLHTSDLHLILTFVGRQPGLLTNESYFPLCLPRFDSSGFLYAYTCCLDPLRTRLSIVLISPKNSQFENFRAAANRIRKNLGLPLAKSSILRIYETASSASTSSSVTNSSENLKNTGTKQGSGDLITMSDMSGCSDDSEQRKTHFDDAAWKREEAKEDDYDDDIFANGRGIVGRIRPAGMTRRYEFGKGHHTKPELDLDSASLGSVTSDSLQSKHGPILSALHSALSSNCYDEMMTNYLQLASAVHFVFRCDIYVGNGKFHESYNSNGIGMITQCFGPPLSFPFTDPSSQRHVWNVYQRLSLRLRLGSSSVETTMDATDQISSFSVDTGDIYDCPMQRLIESPPNVHGVTYVQEGNEWLFVGLNGRFFELYATLPGTIPPRNGTAYCARLVRTLMGDERTLFLSNPLTWES